MSRFGALGSADCASKLTSSICQNARGDTVSNVNEEDGHTESVSSDPTRASCPAGAVLVPASRATEESICIIAGNRLVANAESAASVCHEAIPGAVIAKSSLL